jgi:serine phosphatase RsbU (regulator of sigma subunit)
MYTGSVTEAAKENDEEFGERRPAEQLRAHACLPHRSMSDQLFRAFSAFLARDFRTTLH